MSVKETAGRMDDATAVASRHDVAGAARGGLAGLVGAVVSAVANFALVFVVARYVSRHDAGVFFGATSLFLILETLLRLGGDVGAVYFVARWIALGEPSRIRAGMRVIFRPVLIACVVVGVAMFVAAPALCELIGDQHHQSVGLLRLLAAVLPVAAAYDVALGATRGFGRMRATVLVERIGRPLLQLALVGAVLAFGWRAGIGAAWAVPYLAAAVAAALALHADLRTVPGAGKTERDPGVAREFWRFAAPRAVAGAAQIVLQRLDIVLVAVLRGAAEAAVYTAATRFLVFGQFVSQAIGAPVQPRLSAALAGGEHGRAAALYRASTAWIVLLSWPLFGTVAVFAAQYAGLFGHGYRTGAAVVVILAASMLVATAVGVVDSVVIMAGRTSWNLGTTLGALVVNVVLDVVLIPPFGIVGAAIGWCAAIVAANVVPLVLVWRGLGLHPFGRATGAACLLAAVCFGVLPVAGRLAGTRIAVAGVAVGIVLYLAGLWRWRALFDLTALRRAARPRRPVSTVEGI